MQVGTDVFTNVYITQMIIFTMDENQGQAKNPKNRHIGSKGLFRSNVSFLKTQHHQRMKHNTIKHSLKYYLSSISRSSCTRVNLYCYPTRDRG